MCRCNYSDPLMLDKVGGDDNDGDDDKIVHYDEEMV